jgi:hypothetical protein
MRRQLLIMATVSVMLGILAAVTGWYRDAAVPMLVVGIAYAVGVLVMDRRRR